jgi:putative phage-type endonuclease
MNTGMKKLPKLYFTDLPFHEALAPEVLRVWNLPQYKQRTPEWYEARKKGITASSVSSTLMQSEDACRLWIDTYRHIPKDPFTINPSKTCSYKEQQFEFILSKCGLGKKFEGNEYTRWGQKYEQIVTNIYSQMHQVDMLEFGLIFHPEISFLAASPDGISTHGRMLEIKCPPCREVKPYPPIYYHQQILMQLICTNLKECDYMDAQFVEYINADDWESEARGWEAGNPDVQHHIYGLLLTFTYEDGEDSDPESDDEKEQEESQQQQQEENHQQQEENQQQQEENQQQQQQRLKHIYAPPNIVKIDDFFKWKDETQRKCEERGRCTTITYYKLHQYYICRVETNPEWFNKNYESMRAVWAQIEYGKTTEGQAYLKKLIEEKANKKSNRKIAKNAMNKEQKKLEETAIFIDLDVSRVTGCGSEIKPKFVYDKCLL